MLWALYDAPTDDIPPTAFRVLLVLADHASDDGTAAFPSRASIAMRLRCSERTVQRHFAALREAGLIIDGDQRLVSHLRANRRPTVYDLPLWIRGDIDDSPTGETERVAPGAPGETDTAGLGRQKRRSGETPGVSQNRPKPSRTSRVREARLALCPRCGSDHDQTTTGCPPMGPPPRPLADLVAEVGRLP